MLRGRKAAGHDPAQAERVAVGLWSCGGSQPSQCGFLNWPTRNKCKLCSRPRLRDSRVVSQWWNVSALPAEIVDLANASREEAGGRAQGGGSRGTKEQGREQFHTKPKAKAAPARRGKSESRGEGPGPSWADVVQRKGVPEGDEEEEEGLLAEDDDEDDSMEMATETAEKLRRPEPYVPGGVPRVLLQNEYKALEERRERLSAAGSKGAEKKKELAESRMREVAHQARDAGGLNPGHLPLEVVKIGRKLFAKEKMVRRREQELDEAKARRDEALRGVEAAQQALEDERLRKDNLERRKAYLTAQHAAESQRQEQRERIGIALQELRTGGAAFPPKTLEAISYLSSFIEAIVPQAIPVPGRNVLEGLSSASSSEDSANTMREDRTTGKEESDGEVDKAREAKGAARGMEMLSPKEAAARDLRDLRKQRDADMARAIGRQHASCSGVGTDETPTTVQAILLAYQARIEEAERRFQLASDICEEVPATNADAANSAAGANKRSPPSPTLSVGSDGQGGLWVEAEESCGDVGMSRGAEGYSGGKERQPHGKVARTSGSVGGKKALQRGKASSGGNGGQEASSSDEQSSNSRSPRTVQARKELIAESIRWRNIEGGAEVLN